MLRLPPDLYAAVAAAAAAEARSFNAQVGVVLKAWVEGRKADRRKEVGHGR
jgi:hypothetical protein